MSRPEILNLFERSDWVELPLEEDSSFDYYDKDDSGNPDPENKIYYAVDGNIVSIRGVVTPKKEIAGSASTIPIVKLPDEIVPDGTINQVCQGTNKNTWLLGIDANNNLSFSRYGITGFEKCSPGNWLPFSFTYRI